MTDAAGPDLKSRITPRRLGWIIGVALVVSSAAFVLRGASQPKDPWLLPPGVTTPPPGAPAGGSGRTALPGFGETAITVHLPSGQTLQWCVLLAATQTQQARGLMGVTDPTLGGYDGMLFRFSGPQRSSFYMKDTPMPLSIAFFADGGAFVSQADMAPCLGQATCPLYEAAAPYASALEVPEGGLVRLGIDPDATLVDDHRACTA